MSFSNAALLAAWKFRDFPTMADAVNSDVIESWKFKNPLDDFDKELMVVPSLLASTAAFIKAKGLFDKNFKESSDASAISFITIAGATPPISASRAAAPII
ncbi:MAG: hypothetical protein EBY83_00530 [Verrucomicrobia bacterium]|nr:hypothetical protein [Verrucomicrobiota bacterium]